MIKLYHTTSEIYRPGFRDGATSERSDGNGQGQGFFVWTRREYALKHADFVKEFDDQVNNSIIVQVEPERIDPDVWDLDYEIHSDIASTTLADNFGMFKRLPKGSINIGPYELDIDGSSLFASDQGTMMRFNYGGHRYCIKAGTSEGNMGTARVLGKVFNAIQKHFPQDMAKIKQGWFSNLDSLKALKYTGKEPQPVTNIESLV